MLYNNREYPHPVLGIGDSIEGKFTVDLNIITSSNLTKIEPAFVLENKDLEKLVAAKKAVYAIQIYCRATMYRKIFKSNIQTSQPIEISTPYLRDEVEVDFFLCANENIASYINKSTHPDYEGHAFQIEKGEILAYGGKGLFNANKTPEELKAISAFMNIDKHTSKSGPCYNFYDGNKITILLSETDYYKYQHLATNPFVSDILHSSVVLPALLDAIDIVQAGGSDYTGRKWHIILEKLIDETKEENLFKIGQKILSNPINRGMNTLEELINFEN